MNTVKPHPIKTDLIIVAVCVAVFLAIIIDGTGCKTTTTVAPGGQTNTTTQLDPERTADAIRVLVAAGVPFAIAKDTNAAPYLRAVAVVFKAAANDGQYDPSQVTASLDKISVKELRGPEATALAQAIMGAYKASFGKAVTAKLNETQWAVPVLNAIADGIDAALPSD